MQTRSITSLLDERGELFVGHEPVVRRPELLDRREQLRVALLGHVEAELLGLDPDRVEAALLAEHDRARRGDELGRVGLDRRRVVELARDGAALAAVERARR